MILLRLSIRNILKIKGILKEFILINKNKKAVSNTNIRKNIKLTILVGKERLYIAAICKKLNRVKDVTWVLEKEEHHQ